MVFCRFILKEFMNFERLAIGQFSNETPITSPQPSPPAGGEGAEPLPGKV
jgi:hypothetical protein